MSTTNNGGVGGQRPPLTKDERRASELALYNYHKAVIEQNLRPNTAYVFSAKVPFLHKQIQGLKIIGMFDNELTTPNRDIYIELTNSWYEPIDQARTLYRLRYNPHFAQEYEQDQSWQGSSKKYNVRLEDLELVHFNQGPQQQVAYPPQPQARPQWNQPAQQAQLPMSGDDMAMKDLTARDYAALQLKVPLSNKQWLNDMIKQAATWQQRS